MNAAATRQDVQSALDRVKLSIIGNMLSRNDVQNFVGQMRNSMLQDLHELHAENQQNIRISQTQHEQIIQRVATLQQQVARLGEQQAQILTLLQRTMQPNGVWRRY